MTYEQLMQAPQHLLLKCISGSNAYNLNIPGSDIDYKGVFVLPRQELYGMRYTPQVSNESNDEVYYEVGRFVELLCKNNPNILELLSTDTDAVLFRHPLMDLIRPEDFLSKLCLDSFAGYAKTQIKKARGLNKKINRPIGKARKSVLDFCFVQEGTGTLPLQEWLDKKGLRQEKCGLTQLSHFRDGYLVYAAGNGIVSSDAANDVSLSPISKGEPPLAVMHFNKDGYSVYCREYREYWQWMDERNDLRYEQALAHGKQYDAKNMMHTFRLLNMALEIATRGEVIVRRPDRDFLLLVRSGEFEYEALMAMVEEKTEQIDRAFAASPLQAAPDEQHAEKILRQIRTTFYENR